MRRILIVMLLAGAVLTPGGARAEVAMDDRADARELSLARPLWTVDYLDATIEPGEDLSCLADAVDVAPAIELQSVWYRISPATDLTLYVRAWPSGGVSRGLGLFEAGSATPMACGTDDGSMVLRAPLHRERVYEVQVSCACDVSRWVRSWQIEVGVVPENDDQSRAKVARELPYEDVAFLGAGTADGNTAACDTIPTVAPVPIPSSVADWQSPNAWYRFDASSDDVLLARAYRVPGGPAISVYELRGDGVIEPVTCSTANSTNANESYRPYYETTMAMFEVHAGGSYLIEIDEGSNPPENTYFSLSRATTTDVSVNEVGVSPPRGPTGTVRTISVDLDASPELGPNTYDVVEVCPVPGPDEACTELDNDALEWDTAGCVGDVRVKATAVVPFALDTDPTNNTGETIVHLAGSPIGAGGGTCNLRWLTELVYR